MGVTGLWRLIEPAGKPVPVETLENKVLAVDISIWLHQMVKGYQDAKGAPLPNAHLMGLFQRLCKLLYFRVKPVFVFDGGFPDLKKETIAKRQDHKAKYNSESERLKRELALLLSKKTAISSLLGNQILPKKKNDGQTDDDIFKLPALPQKDEDSESDSEDETNSSGSSIDVHSVDIQSQNFKNLPLKEKYDLLIELKETRKMNSWGRLHELPKKSDNFSDFQLQRLLKRRKVQECLEETEKEMGDSGMSLNELESLLNEEGIDTKIDSLPTRRIAANNTTRYVLINNVKQALADAKKKNEVESKASTSTIKEEPIIDSELPKRDELDEDLEKAIKMSLECVSEIDTSACTSKTDESWTSCLTDTDYSDSEDDFGQPDMSSAKAYIMQFSDFTNKAINEIVTGNKTKDKNTHKLSKVDEVLNEINREKLFITAQVDLLSNQSSPTLHENYSNDNDDLQDQNTYKYDNRVKNNLDDQNNSGVIVSSVTASVNPDEKIVTLDSSSTDENEHTKTKDNKSANVESDSSEEDFEEVPEINMVETSKTVVQLTLNTNNVSDSDDIFADIFHSRNQDIEVNTDMANLKSEPYLASIIIPNNENLIEDDTDKKIIQNISNKCDENLNINSNIEALNPTENEDMVEKLCDNSDTQRNITNDTNITFDNERNTDADQSNKTLPDTNNDGNKLPLQSLPTEMLNSMAEELQIEEQDLLQEKGRLDRVGRNITQQMTKEAQELLQIFGIPYIVAPMEAEAQCAFLESVNLTDGTITDDSDIWLFGGRTVYKNFFNQKKHVLQFLADRIEKSFNLNREQLILLALLVGSDYTTGVTGVGPVTALEILASFPLSKKQVDNENTKQARYNHIVTGLQDFKKWVHAGKRTDNTNLKKKLKNVTLGNDFPSVRVVQAYLEPNVEKSEDRFTWGELDITILRDYTKTKFGWSQHKLDEIIKPVLKRILERKSQKTVEDFFKRKVEFHSLEDQMSKRVKAAVQRMGLSSELVPEQEETEGKAKLGRKRKANKHDTTYKVTNKSSKGKAPIKDEASVLNDHGVKVVSQIMNSKSALDIKIPKTDYVQEVIPQRERDKQCLLQNKLKAIELFRKTKIDSKKKTTKKKIIQPKQKADLSESDSE